MTIATSRLQQLADQVRQAHRHELVGQIQIGKALAEAKAGLAHGKWLRWLKKEFKWSQPVASRYMQVAKVLGDKIERLNYSLGNNLTLKALAKLAARTTPSALRTEIIERAGQGERITVAEIERRIALVRPHRPPSPRQFDSSDPAMRPSSTSVAVTGLAAQIDIYLPRMTDFSEVDAEDLDELESKLKQVLQLIRARQRGLRVIPGGRQ